MGLDPFTAIAITGVAGAAASGVGAAMQGGQSTPQVKLSPEMEAQQIELIGQSIDDYNKERERTLAVADTLQQRGEILANMDLGLIPKDQAFAKITEQNQMIAEKFGDEILGMVDDLTGDLNYQTMLREKGETILKSGLQEFKDPTVEREISDGKVALEEQLAKQLGPGWATSESGIRALRQFEQSATELRADASSKVRGEEVNTLTALTGQAGALTSSKLAVGQSLFQGRESAISDLFTGIGTQLNINQAGLQDLVQSAQTGQSATELVKTPFSLMSEFGTQKISKDTTKAIEAGAYSGYGFADVETEKEWKQRNKIGATPSYAYNKAGWIKNTTSSPFSQYAKS